ncbi:MAG: hypothetical protein SFV55_17825 [Haliscomenobacter sp.]|uniref:SWIM zinc finger family protein n=1 Tax=Haliscomenobacter sp. TaxID=2717303 RepID=UPI0029B701FB|nr:hypothetical protein [Haliscomenobacter sp.]MDX2070292.1 hypothetical protein [Haliscomenobacter sp.]
MQFLIHLPIQSTLAEAIQNLSDARMYAIFGPVILQRSHDYIDQIEDVDYAPGLAQTLIYGSEEYEVDIKHEANTARLYGDCSCPYDGGACKHLAAFLQYLREAKDLDEINYVENTSIVITSSEPAGGAPFDFKAWVKARSREELETLVLQHAPESLRKSLALQSGSVTAQQELFQKAEKKVKKILNNAYEYDLYTYEEKLLKHLETLRPLWSLMPEKIFKLLRKVVEGIDNAKSEGYLYDDYNDGVFEGIELGAYIAEFVSSLPEPLFVEGLSEILEVFGNLQFAICDNFWSVLLPKLNESKGVNLKNLFIANDLLSQQAHDQQQAIWFFLKPLLNTTEQKQLLKTMSDPFFMLELVDLYEQEGQGQEAILLLTRKLPQPVKKHWNDSYNIAYGSEPLYEKLLELLHKDKQNQDLKKWVYRYVEERATARSLSFSLQFLPEAQTELETLLKKRQVGNFAQYLEESFRTPEVVQLFKSHPKDFPQVTQYDFFKRNLLLFPKEAQVIFKQVLEQALPIAKEYSYQRVVEVLLLLRELMEKQTFVALVQAIRAEYKRRPNLVALMQSAGLHFPEK